MQQSHVKHKCRETHKTIHSTSCINVWCGFIESWWDYFNTCLSPLQKQEVTTLTGQSEKPTELLFKSIYLLIHSHCALWVLISRLFYAWLYTGGNLISTLLTQTTSDPVINLSSLLHRPVLWCSVAQNQNSGFKIELEIPTWTSLPFAFCPHTLMFFWH